MEEKPKKISYKSLTEKMSDNALKKIVAGSGGGGCNIYCTIAWLNGHMEYFACCGYDLGTCYDMIYAIEDALRNAGEEICGSACGNI